MMSDSIEGLVIPEHIAIILDGNGRWAAKNGVPRAQGHKAGCETLEGIVEDCYIQNFYLRFVLSI